MNFIKFLKIILLLVYVAFAVVQWNDPDPVFWIIIYGLAALILLLNLLGWHSRLLLGICITAGILYSLTYVGGVIEYFTANDLGAIADKMHYDRPYIELTREFFGLWIVLGGLILVFFKK